MEQLRNVINDFGGPGKFAAALGVAPNRLGNWMLRGVPLEYAAAIEAISGGAVMRWHLRPDDWHTIWPELRKRKDAPKEATHG
jgi:DNA-binding transcriptional regulator YdaS (Cro superfamily)